MKKYLLAIAASFTMTAVHAQCCDSLSCDVKPADNLAQKTLKSQKSGIFRNLDLSVTAGTTGIGIDVASKLGSYVQLRAGYEYMPRVNVSLYFPVEVGGQAAKLYDDDGNRIESRFDRLSNMLNKLTGLTVSDEVEMVGKPTLNNFKFLVDVFPFRNKHWHFTAGFYWGSSQYAYAENSTAAMTSLLAVNMYNQIYAKCVADMPLFDIPNMPTMTLDPVVQEKIASYGRMGFEVGCYKNDVYGMYESDVYDPTYPGNVLHEKGEYGLLHAAGDPYVLEPDPQDGMVKVYAKSNPFKPYIGFGYGGRLMKNRDDWQVSFDAGAMFWGGTPDLYTHDGTNLTKDVENIKGKVGDWVDFLGAIKVYPVLSVRFTKTIFK